MLTLFAAAYLKKEMKRVPEEWTGEIVMKLHNNRIKRAELAEEMGVTKPYISMVLNGVRNTPGMQERIEAAVDRLIERKRA